MGGPRPGTSRLDCRAGVSGAGNVMGQSQALGGKRICRARKGPRGDRHAADAYAGNKGRADRSLSGKSSRQQLRRHLAQHQRHVRRQVGRSNTQPSSLPRSVHAALGVLIRVAGRQLLLEPLPNLGKLVLQALELVGRLAVTLVTGVLQCAAGKVSRTRRSINPV